MAKKRDYYEILGLSKNASEDEIKKSYRTLAKKYHPDISKEPNAEEKFKEASEAAEILLDPKKRQMYDQFGHDGVNGQAGFSGSKGFEDFFSGFGGGNDFFGDIFEGFFGGSRRSGSRGRSQSSRAQDIIIDLNLSISEIFHGKEFNQNLEIDTLCEACKGIGAESEADIIKCDICNGVGHVNVIQDMGIAKFQTQKICPKCKGAGKTVKNECKPCRGNGVTKKKQNIAFKIPKGLSDGQQIIIENSGNFGKKGQKRGHIYANVNVLENKTIKIVNDFDLLYRLDVNYLDAILGKTLEFKVFGNKITLKIPKGVKNGQLIIENNKGLKRGVNSNIYGKLIFETNIVVPNNLTKEEENIIKDLSSKSNYSNKYDVE